MQSKEMEEFKKLQALHGFAGSSNFEKQSNSALFKAVEKGRMSAVDYHEKRILQKVSERKGVDDSSSATFGNSYFFLGFLKITIHFPFFSRCYSKYQRTIY